MTKNQVTQLVKCVAIGAIMGLLAVLTTIWTFWAQSAPIDINGHQLTNEWIAIPLSYGALIGAVMGIPLYLGLHLVVSYQDEVIGTLSRARESDAKQKEAAEAELATASLDIGTLQSDLRVAKEREENLSQQLTRAIARGAELDEQLRESNQHQELVAAREQVEMLKTQLEEARAKLVVYETKEELASEEAELEEAREALFADSEPEAANNMQSLTDDISVIDTDFLEELPDCEKPSAGPPVPLTAPNSEAENFKLEEAEEHIVKLEGELDEAKTRINELEGQLETAIEEKDQLETNLRLDELTKDNDELTEAKDLIVNLREEIKDISTKADNEAVEQIQALRDQLDLADRKIAQFEEDQTDKTQLKTQLIALSERDEANKRNLATIQEEKAGLETQVARLETLAENLTNANLNAEEIKANLDKTTRLLAASRNDRDIALARIEKLEVELSTAQEEVKTKRVTDQLMSSKPSQASSDTDPDGTLPPPLPDGEPTA